MCRYLCLYYLKDSLFHLNNVMGNEGNVGNERNDKLLHIQIYRHSYWNSHRPVYSDLVLFHLVVSIANAAVCGARCWYC